MQLAGGVQRQGYEGKHGIPAEPCGPDRNHGQGATTRAPTGAALDRFLRRVRRKIPCGGREALGL